MEKVSAAPTTLNNNRTITPLGHFSSIRHIAGKAGFRIFLIPYQCFHLQKFRHLGQHSYEALLNDHSVLFIIVTKYPTSVLSFNKYVHR